MIEKADMVLTEVVKTNEKLIGGPISNLRKT